MAYCKKSIKLILSEEERNTIEQAHSLLDTYLGDHEVQPVLEDEILTDIYLRELVEALEQILNKTETE